MESMLRSSAWALLLLLPYTALADDSAALRRIEKQVEQARKRNWVPGASLAIVKDDKVIFARGFGLRDVAKKLPATPTTIYDIGSSTKAFTGLLVALSAQDGKLALTDSPKKYLANFALKDKDAEAKIQILDMLAHRSGLPRTDVAWYTGKFSRADIIEMLPTFEPTAKLGQKWQYNNVMYMLAGEIAARVNGTTYEDLLRQRIFGPLGMNSTTVTYTDAMASKELAQGYLPSGPWTAKNTLPYRNIDAAAPAGGINSNVLDMAQWVRLQLNEGTVDGKEVARKDTVEETRKPRMEIVPGSGFNYGIGWMMKKWNDTPEIEHGGNIDGYNALVSFLPEKHIGLVMLTNVSNSSLPAQAMEIVYKELVGEPKKPEAKKEEAKPQFKPAEEGDFGSYDLAFAKVTLIVKKEGDKIILDQSGVKIPLKLTADKTYEPDMANAPKFKISFQPDKKDPKATEMLLEQSGMKFTLPKTPPYTAPMSGEALLAKVVAAQGGPEAIRKERHMVAHVTTLMVSDSITMKGIQYGEGGNKAAEFGVFFALNRRFGWVHNFSNGPVAWNGTSFTKNFPTGGSAAIDAANSANIEMDLQPAKFYKSLKITREDKVNGEEAYVLEKTPRQGAKIVQYISKKTFLPVKRDIGLAATVFEDYRNVEGLMLPFKITVETPESGKQIITVDSVSFTEPIPAWVFRWVDEKK